MLKWLLAVLITEPSCEELFWTSTGHLTGIHLSRVHGEEGGSTRLLRNQLLLCLMLWFVGSWGKVIRTSGRCLQASGEAGGQEDSDSVPIPVSRCVLPFPSLQAPSRRELRTPREAAGAGRQGKGRSCRINGNMLCWRAGKNKKDAHYLDRTVKSFTGEACQLGYDRRRMSCCPLAQPGKSLRNAER